MMQVSAPLPANGHEENFGARQLKFEIRRQSEIACDSRLGRWDPSGRCQKQNARTDSSVY